MVKGFYYRLAVLFLATASVSLLIASAAMLPSYFLSSTKGRIADTKLNLQKNKPVPVPEERTLSIIKDLNTKLALVEKAESSTFIVSEKVIKAILLRKMSDIKITDISYEDNSGGAASLGRKINIEGTAPSREILLFFRQALEDDVNFKSVDLPISNFIKGSNIQFSLNLISS